MARWLRLYTNAPRHAKLLGLSPAVKWFWIELLCIASQQEENGLLGTTQSVQRCATIRADLCKKRLDTLHKRGLILARNGQWYVHDWGDWQYVSDQSNQRVKAYRDRYSNATRNASVTPPDTDRKIQTRAQTVTLPAPSVARGPVNGLAHSGANSEEVDMRHGEKIGHQVFVKEGTEAWRAWSKHRGSVPPINKDFGWFFDSEFPPNWKATAPAISPADEDKEIPF